MLTTRLWMGAVLIALAVGMLVFDQRLHPWYPFLFAFLLGLALAGCHELVGLLGPDRAPQPLMCYGGVALLGLANWAVHLLGDSAHAWTAILGCFAALLLAILVWEMATF